MAVTFKVLGQANPAATTATSLYTVPVGVSAVVSTIAICNQAVTSDTFRIAIRPAGASLVAQHYIAYNNAIAANDTVTLTIGITLAATDVVTVYAGTSTLSFSIFGSEIS
jgi:hypothetical protein